MVWLGALPIHCMPSVWASRRRRSQRPCDAPLQSSTLMLASSLRAQWAVCKSPLNLSCTSSYRNPHSIRSEASTRGTSFIHLDCLAAARISSTDQAVMRLAKAMWAFFMGGDNTVAQKTRAMRAQVARVRKGGNWRNDCCGAGWAFMKQPVSPCGGDGSNGGMRNQLGEHSAHSPLGSR